MFYWFNRLLLKIHNLTGVSSLEYKNHKFSVSIPLIGFNILNLVGIFVTRRWLHGNEAIYDKILVDTFPPQEESRFLRNFYTTSYQLIHLLAASSILINIIRQKKIAKLLNVCIKIKMSEKLLKRLQLNVTISSYLILFYFFIDCFIQYVLYYQKNFLAFTFYYVELFPYTIMLSSLIATKNFEIFLSAAFEQILSELNKTNWNTLAYKRQLLRLVYKYQQLSEICEGFNEVFGSQLTYMTCYSTIILIFRVNIEILSSIALDSYFHISLDVWNHPNSTINALCTDYCWVNNWSDTMAGVFHIFLDFIWKELRKLSKKYFPGAAQQARNWQIGKKMLFWKRL